jgi:hypothetical protein
MQSYGVSLIVRQERPLLIFISESEVREVGSGSLLHCSPKLARDHTAQRSVFDSTKWGHCQLQVRQAKNSQPKHALPARIVKQQREDDTQCVGYVPCACS